MIPSSPTPWGPPLTVLEGMTFWHWLAIVSTTAAVALLLRDLVKYVGSEAHPFFEEEDPDDDLDAILDQYLGDWPETCLGFTLTTGFYSNAGGVTIEPPPYGERPYIWRPGQVPLGVQGLDAECRRRYLSVFDSTGRPLRVPPTMYTKQDGSYYYVSVDRTSQSIRVTDMLGDIRDPNTFPGVVKDMVRLMQAWHFPVVETPGPQAEGPQEGSPPTAYWDLLDG